MTKIVAVATDCMLHNQNRSSEHTIGLPLIQLTIHLLATITNRSMYTVHGFVSHCPKNASSEYGMSVEVTGNWKIYSGKYTLVNPAVPQTPIVGVHRCLSGSSTDPRWTPNLSFIFSSRGVRSTSRKFCRINRRRTPMNADFIPD